MPRAFILMGDEQGVIDLYQSYCRLVLSPPTMSYAGTIDEVWFAAVWAQMQSELKNVL